MHDSRKTLLNVLFDNLINVFNITTVIFLLMLFIYQSFILAIPLILSLCASIVSLIIDLKNYVLGAKNNQRLNVVADNNEQEKILSELKIGDSVTLYPNEKINFFGKVKSGVFYVDESLINGSTKLVKKVEGSSIIKGSVVIEGNGIVEVTGLGRKISQFSFAKETKLKKRIKLLNFGFSAIALIAYYVTFFLGGERMDNILKCSIVAIPYLLNIILTTYFVIKSKKGNKGIEIFDHTFLAELQDVDVVCLDKSGTLTTGEYEIFKTVILSQTSFSSISIDSNRAFEQVVSNIIKTTKENSGYYSLLQNHFIYDVSKVIDDSSSLRKNGLYSAVTIRGGNTYALGELENFELSNLESTLSIINEYQSAGYRVLVLVESKNPLKSGLIDGKPTAIGLIVLQEIIRESAKDLIKYCLENGKQIKVISGDQIAIVSEVSRKAGLENKDRATSIKLVPVEKVALLLEEDVVFADASPSHKAFIIKELQRNGHKVAFIGNGDNDIQALKAANVAISLKSGSESAIKCSHACVNDSFTLSNSFLKESKNFKNKMDAITAITYSQTGFASFYLLAFIIASFINKSIYNPFEYHHLLLWTLFGILIPCIVLLMDKSDGLKQKHFLRNVVSNTVLLIVPIGIMYILQLLQYSGNGYFGLPSDLNDLHETLITSSVTNNLSYLSLTIMSLVIVYNHYAPFSKYKTMAFATIIFLPIVYAVLLAFSVDEVSIITQIDSHDLNPINYFVMGVITLSCSALYLLVLDIISTLKGENPDVKSKSKD